MSIRLYNSSGGYIDLESGGTSAAANVFTLPAETGTILTSATTSGINASALSAGTLPGARLPAGSVLQVVQATFANIQQTTTSTSYVDTSITASITPASASNKVLILITSQCNPQLTSEMFAIKRNSTDIADALNRIEGNAWIPVTISYLDSPNSTSAVSYTLRFRSSNGTLVYHGWGSSSGGSSQNIVLMEIAA